MIMTCTIQSPPTANKHQNPYTSTTSTYFLFLSTDFHFELWLTSHYSFIFFANHYCYPILISIIQIKMVQQSPSTTKKRSHSILMNGKEHLTEMHEKVFGMEASTDPNSNKLTFNQLKRAEKHRRELLQRSKMFSREHLYLQIWGTVIPAVIKSGEFWFSLFIFIIIRIFIIHNVTTIQEISIDSKLVASIGGFISFMLVFYNNQVYGRYAAQYDNSMKIESKIINLTYFARDNLQMIAKCQMTSTTPITPTSSTNIPTPFDSKGVAMVWQFVRYLNGAHILGYVGLSDTYEYDNLFKPFNKQYNIFTSNELQRLYDMNSIDESHGVCYREVLGWATSILQEAHRSGQLVAVVYNNMMNELLQLRGHISTLYEYEDQPIPFVYVHLIYFLVLFYLPLFSFFVATSFDGLHKYGNFPGFLVVFLNSLFTIGLLEIGRFMSEPYGSDHCDLSVMFYLSSTWRNCRKILSSKRFDLTSYEIELNLEQARHCLGDGFINGTMTCDFYSEDMKNIVQQNVLNDSDNVLHHNVNSHVGHNHHSHSNHPYRHLHHTLSAKNEAFDEEVEDIV